MKSAIELAFTHARTFNTFQPRPIDDEVIHALYDSLKWGPTSMNCQPGRYLFLRSPEAKRRLVPILSPGNLEKTMAAPLTVLVAQDTQFFEHMPIQFPAVDAKPMFASNSALSQATAFRNSSLQGAYLIIAARLLGLDAGPMSGFDSVKMDAEFFPDGRLRTNFLVNLGYGNSVGNRPRGPRMMFDEVASIL